MTLENAFKDYHKQYLDDLETENKIRTIIKTNPKIGRKDVVDGMAGLEDYLKTIPGYKYRSFKVYMDLAAWLRQHGFDNLSTSMSTPYLALTRRIELIKYLQQPHTREEISQTFCIADRQLNDDFVALERGIEILGCRLKVRFKKYDRDGRVTIDDNNYQSSCNPIFLPLNMTELYLLTNVVPSFLNSNLSLTKSYQAIMEKIYPQLSEYSAKLINVNKEVSSNQISPFVFEYSFLRNNIFNMLIYLMKRGMKATFIIINNGSPEEIFGRVLMLDDDYIVIETEDADIKINYSDFLSIRDFEGLYQ